MELGKVLIFLGAILLVAGLVLLLLGRMNLPLARLPGDFLYRFSVIAFLSFRPEHFIPEGNEMRSGGTCFSRRFLGLHLLQNSPARPALKLLMPMNTQPSRCTIQLCITGLCCHRRVIRIHKLVRC